MDYVIVRANGPDADYTITTDYGDALRTYRSWVAAYLAETDDQLARTHLDRLNHSGHELRGEVIEYRSPSDGESAQTGQVFVLGVLAWPTTWLLPPGSVDHNWGKTIRQLARPEGTFELRTDGEAWRILWFDARSEAAFTTSRAYRVAAEAAAEFAFIEAFLSRQPGHGSPPSPPSTSGERG